MEIDRKRHSNLLSFLSHTTPSVPAYPLPKMLMQNQNPLWQPVGKDRADFFTLGDLWEQYDEWSVYGAGVPIILNDHQNVDQYYVPYLSAIQLYTTKSPTNSRAVLEESESESFSDDSESERLSKSWDATSEDSQDSLWPVRKNLGQLYFQYVEFGSPYGRIPLRDKVNQLAHHFPGLTSLKSVEISPASWMSVAWYPICQIPSRTNAKDLSACFLTYHTISAAFQDDMPEDIVKDYYHTSVERKPKQKKGANCIPLFPFGLATYKMHGSLWRNPGTSDNVIISTLHGAASSWLKQLRVEHHDFNFFTTH